MSGISLLGWLLIGLAAVCAILAIAYQLDAFEARYQRRLEEQIRQWEASQRGSAKVEDFERWQADRDKRGAA